VNPKKLERSGAAKKGGKIRRALTLAAGDAGEGVMMQIVGRNGRPFAAVVLRRAATKRSAFT
jgi:hypothetical protein